MFVKPAPNLSVRVPPGMQLLPAQGGNVPDTSYWYRALGRGDVVEATPPAPAPAPPPRVVPAAVADVPGTQGAPA